jgi:type II secretion system protein N
MVDRETLLRWLLLFLYFTAAFFLFLLVLFPFDRVKARLESEFRLRTPLELNVARMSPRFFNRFVLSDVVVSGLSGKVLFESKEVHTSVSLFDLLRGVLTVKMQAGAYGGDMLIRAQQGPGRQYLMIDADGLDLAAYPALKEFGLRLSGKLGGNFELNGDTGKGRLWLKGLTSRELKVKGFPVPDLDFDKGWIEAELRGDRLTMKKVELDGKDLTLRVSGDLVLRERGTLNLTIKLKPSERLAHEQSGLVSFLQKKDADGFYQIGLGGLLSEPVPRF